jgi:hypothetical protein
VSPTTQGTQGIDHRSTPPRTKAQDFFGKRPAGKKTCLVPSGTPLGEEQSIRLSTLRVTNDARHAGHRPSLDPPSNQGPGFLRQTPGRKKNLFGAIGDDHRSTPLGLFCGMAVLGACAAV